jgi:transcriptional regulator with XRE-family HTH domain
VRYNWRPVLNERLLRFGASVRAVRTALGLSQCTFADRIGRSQVYVSLVERARVPGLSIAEADSICQALGATLVLGIEAPVLAAGSRQRDAAHAQCEAYVTRRLTRDGWIVRREVQIGNPARPGWVDVLAFHPETRVLLVIEVKTELIDFGGLERQLGWYSREARDAGKALGWEPVAVATAALVLATAVNDDRIRQNALGIRQAFPRRWGDLMDIVHGGEPMRGWGLALIDPRSRVRNWCRPIVLDGRRSQAPYRHVADFLRKGR